MEIEVGHLHKLKDYWTNTECPSEKGLLEVTLLLILHTPEPNMANNHKTGWTEW